MNKVKQELKKRHYKTRVIFYLILFFIMSLIVIDLVLFLILRGLKKEADVKINIKGAEEQTKELENFLNQ